MKFLILHQLVEDLDKMLKITKKVLSIDEVLNSIKDPEAGAVVLFIGTVRSKTEEKTVVAIEYEAYDEMAIRQVEKLEKEIRNRWNIKNVIILHRIGRLIVGDKSIIIGISSPHRDEAFKACRYAIEFIKQDVPIWKKEFFKDGGVWIDKNNLSQTDDDQSILQ